MYPDQQFQTNPCVSVLSSVHQFRPFLHTVELLLRTLIFTFPLSSSESHTGSLHFPTWSIGYLLGFYHFFHSKSLGFLCKNFYPLSLGYNYRKFLLNIWTDLNITLLQCLGKVKHPFLWWCPLEFSISVKICSGVTFFCATWRIE